MAGKIVTLFMALVLFSCLDPLEAPGPVWEPETFASGEPNLSFTVRASGISPGSVRFRNYSSGMLEFTWYLGFNDESGYEATTQTPAPTLKYPQNGKYYIRLKGLGTDSITYWSYGSVEISNMPD